MEATTRQHVLFIGHGSPMNAVAENEYTRMLRALGARLPCPKAVLCVSAHWMTEGTWVTHMVRPRTIHDFRGFPKALFDIQYPAAGDPRAAEMIQAAIKQPRINLDDEMWGLDHGTWSVLRHMYPNADVPVMQLSIDMAQPPAYHFELGQALRPLRDQGILVVGSGNIVHNLREIEWDEAATAYDWAVEFDSWVQGRLEARDFAALVADATSSQAGRLAIPTAEHWYPLLYTIGAADSADALRVEYEGIQNASISMRSLSFGSHT